VTAPAASAAREHTGWILDTAARPGGVSLVFRTEGGETLLLSAPFSFSFTVAGSRIPRAAAAAFARRASLSLSEGEGTLFFSGRTVPAYRFSFPDPARLSRLVRLAEGEFGLPALFDADVDGERRFAFATGLYPLSRARLRCGPDGVVGEHEVLDSPWDVDAPLPEISTALLRPEGDGHPGQGRPRPLLFSWAGRTERIETDDAGELLSRVLRLVAAADPDLLLSDWGDEVLLPQLRGAAARLRRPFSLDRPLAAAAPAGAREPLAARSYWSYGRPVFRAETHHLFGRWHVDRKNAFLYSEGGLEGLAELSRLSGIPLQRTARSSPGTAISSMEVALALSRGILVPFKKREPERFRDALDLLSADKGGLTYLPRPGLHGNVAELDFASMYPSLMDRFNLSPETMDCSCCAGGGGIPVPGTTHHACGRRRGLIPDVLAPVLEKRRLLKGRQKGAAGGEERERFRRRQTALKWLLVVSFGFLGYRNARFGRIEAHEATTAWGREMLLRAKETAEGEGFSFLHGLTDAVWVRKEGATEGEYRRLAERITDDTGMPIALEGVYRWVAFLPSKGNPAVAVPNRYAGAFEGGEVKARGIVLRRSDALPAAAALQRALLARMAEARDPAELSALAPELSALAEGEIVRLREGRVPVRELILSRRLSKEAEGYRESGAVPSVVRELSGRGVLLRPGSRVRYLLVDGGAAARRAKGRGAPAEGRAEGFLDGSEIPDLPRYEALLRDAAEELLGPLRRG
jgi:DNA polymerase-2